MEKRYVRIKIVDTKITAITTAERSETVAPQAEDVYMCSTCDGIGTIITCPNCKTPREPIGYQEGPRALES